LDLMILEVFSNLNDSVKVWGTFHTRNTGAGQDSSDK